MKTMNNLEIFISLELTEDQVKDFKKHLKDAYGKRYNNDQVEQIISDMFKRWPTEIYLILRSLIDNENNRLKNKNMKITIELSKDQIEGIKEWLGPPNDLTNKGVKFIVEKLLESYTAHFYEFITDLISRNK